MPHTLFKGCLGKSPVAFRFAKEWQEKTDITKAYLDKVSRSLKKWTDEKRRFLGFQEKDMVMIKLNMKQNKAFRKVDKGSDPLYLPYCEDDR